MPEFAFNVADELVRDKFAKNLSMSMRNYRKGIEMNDDKCYFTVNNRREIVEPVMIGNTRVDVYSYELHNTGGAPWIRIEGCLGIPENSVTSNIPLATKIKKVIFNGPCTIVMWDDKTKTIVRRSPGDKNDRGVALIYAIAKKKFGNNSQIQKEIGKFAKSNAQRVAILSYIVARDGFDVDAIYEEYMNEE